MFQHEAMLKSTPIFCWFFVTTAVFYWSYVRFYAEASILAHTSLDIK